MLAPQDPALSQPNVGHPRGGGQASEFQDDVVLAREVARVERCGQIARDAAGAPDGEDTQPAPSVQPDLDPATAGGSGDVRDDRGDCPGPAAKSTWR